MSEIIPFDFETNAVRVVMIEDLPWFVAADVCRVLEHSNSRMALQMLDDDEKGVRKVYTRGGEQEMNIVSESGLYALILRSTKPAAKKFRKWVTAEVLPAIRRDGAYRLDIGDRADLQAKRIYAESLPDDQKAMAAEKAKAIRQLDQLVAEGVPVGEALDAIVAETGIGKRTLYYAKSKVWMVPSADYEVALSPRWRANGPRGMMAECHPDALIRFMQLSRSEANVSEAYRLLMAEAQANGWSPIPSDRTLRRAVNRLMPRPGKAERVKVSGAV